MKNWNWNLIVSCVILGFLALDKFLLSPLWKRKSELMKDQSVVYDNMKSTYEVNKENLEKTKGMVDALKEDIQRAEQSKEFLERELYQLMYFSGGITYSIGYMPIVEETANRMLPSFAKTIILEGIKKKRIEMYTELAVAMRIGLKGNEADKK